MDETLPDLTEEAEAEIEEAQLPGDWPDVEVDFEEVDPDEDEADPWEGSCLVSSAILRRYLKENQEIRITSDEADLLGIPVRFRG